MAILERQVAASSDDCYVYWDGSKWTISSLTSSYLMAGYNAETVAMFGSGMRFQTITIPKGAIINTAYLTFICKSGESTTTVNSRITGEKVDAAATWSTLEDYQTRRGTVVGGANDDYITSAQVDWDNIGEWVEGDPYNSPSIVSIIQEIVNRVGWASENALALWWDDHDNRSTNAINCRRQAASWDDTEYDPPALYVEYTPPGFKGSRGYIIG